MSTSIDQAFIKQFESEVHAAYQRKASKLRSTVRNVSNVKGSSTTFQKTGKGVAGPKTRHGVVPVMNVQHTAVECILHDYYAGDWVDKLDELKVNIDERQVLANAGAFALGRKTDEIIINALDEVAASGQLIAHGGAGMTLDKAMQVQEIHGNNDVFEEQEMFTIVGWKQWNELLQIDEFANSDYVSGDSLPFTMSAGQAKYWLGQYWMPHSGLPITGGVRRCYSYARTAIGHASGADVISDVTWHGDRAAHFVNNMMSQGGCLIDGLGVVEISCNE